MLQCVGNSHIPMPGVRLFHQGWPLVNLLMNRLVKKSSLRRPLSRSFNAVTKAAPLRIRRWTLYWQWRRQHPTFIRFDTIPSCDGRKHGHIRQIDRHDVANTMLSIAIITFCESSRPKYQNLNSDEGQTRPNLLFDLPVTSWRNVETETSLRPTRYLLISTSIGIIHSL